MIIADMHCDLPHYVVDGRKISENNGHWSEDKLNSEHTYIQVFASFVDKLLSDNPFERINALIFSFISELAKSDIKLVTNKYELKENISKGKNSAILAIEGGEALGGKIENLKHFYNMGVRFITLTWNRKNQIGSSSDPSCINEPLTEFGKEVVKEMNRLKITPDVSHLSEKGFFSVAEVSKRPFCATHSNSKKLCHHHRNLTDEQFREIVKCGGVVGINYANQLLEENPDDASLKSIVKHIEYFMSLGGENTVCLGGDLDGVSCLPKGMSGVGDIDKIAEELAKINYNDELIEKIMGKNAVNFFERVL